MKTQKLFYISLIILKINTGNCQAKMKIPNYILKPTCENILIEISNNNLSLIDSSDVKNSIVILNGEKIKFRDYLDNFDSYVSEKYKLSEYILELPFENNPELIIEGFEKLLQFGKESKYLSDYTIIKFLSKLIQIPSYEKYAFEKILSIVKENKSNYTNYNLYWHEFFLLLYDYLPKQEWIKLIENKQVLEYNVYYGFRGISRISALYAREKGFKSVNKYLKLLSNWKKDLQEDGTEINRDQYNKYLYSLYAIRSILEFSKITIAQKEWIRDQLIDKKIFEIPGRIQPLIAICFFICGKESFKTDFKKLFKNHLNKDEYKKLLSLGKIDELSLLKDLKKHNFIKSTNSGQYWSFVNFVSCFPLASGAIWSINNKVLLFGTEEFSKTPSKYDKLINDIFRQLPNLNFEYLIKTSEKKIEKKYEIEIILDKKIYKTSPTDLGDYYDIKTLTNYLNYILFDLKCEERVVPIRTNDYYCVLIISKPSDILNLYNEYDLKLEIDTE